MTRLTHNGAPAAVLRCLDDEGPQTREQLQQLLDGVLPPSGDGAPVRFPLARLLRMGYVAQYVHLTDAGRAALGQLNDRLSQARQEQQAKTPRATPAQGAHS